jgi:hypothetical protein
VKRNLALALAVSGALAAAAGCRRAEETRSLNFDPETTAGSLGAGWDGFEKTALGDTFVWAHGREARLVVQSRADGDRLVRFRCWPFGFPGGPAQTLTFFVNDQKIETVTLGGEARVYSLPTPKGAWTRGVNELKFLFAYAESPKDRVPGSDDGRTLSAAFDWLEILPPAPPAKSR